MDKNKKLYNNKYDLEIPKSDFVRAFKKYPFNGPGEIKDLVCGSDSKSLKER